MSMYQKRRTPTWREIGTFTQGEKSSQVLLVITRIAAEDRKFRYGGQFQEMARVKIILKDIEEERVVGNSPSQCLRYKISRFQTFEKLVRAKTRNQTNVSFQTFLEFLKKFLSTSILYEIELYFRYIMRVRAHTTCSTSLMLKL